MKVNEVEIHREDDWSNDEPERIWVATMTLKIQRNYEHPYEEDLRGEGKTILMALEDLDNKVKKVEK